MPKLHPDDQMAEAVASEKPVSQWGKKHAGPTTFRKGDARASHAGATTSPARAAKLREVGKLGGRPAAEAADRPCTCRLHGTPQQDTTAPENHIGHCARKQAWRRQNREEIAARIL